MNKPGTSTNHLSYHKIRKLGTSTINFLGKILQKNSSWLYIQTGVYITMGPYNIDNKPRYLSTLLLVLFSEIKWWKFLGLMARHLSRKAKRFVREKHSVRFRMRRKDESSRYLESQPICLHGHYTTMYQPNIFWVKYSSNTEIDTSTSSKYLLAHEMSHLRSWPIILAHKYCRKIPMVICTLYVHITMVDFRYKKIVLLVE